MCGGVEVAGRFTGNGRARRIYFQSPGAELPVVQPDGSIQWIPWGRRPRQPGALPASGWARENCMTLEALERYRPQAVKIAVQRYMERDRAQQPHWFDLVASQCLQGVLLEAERERRVYVVIGQPPPGCEFIQDRWPLIAA